MTKHQPSYLSNQSPRTFAPKPDYAVRFWKQRNMRPPFVDIVEVIKRRAERYLMDRLPKVEGFVLRGDSRHAIPSGSERFGFVITSPPYYGMRTYISDQWIRSWFLGAPSEVIYSYSSEEIRHPSPEAFIDQLRQVWKNVGRLCQPSAR